MNAKYLGTYADMKGHCPHMSGVAKQRLTGDIIGSTLWAALPNVPKAMR